MEDFLQTFELILTIDNNEQTVKYFVKYFCQYHENISHDDMGIILTKILKNHSDFFDSLINVESKNQNIHLIKILFNEKNKLINMTMNEKYINSLCLIQNNIFIK